MATERAAEADWVEVECRKGIARLRRHERAIVDRNDPTIRKLIRGAYLVVIGPAPEGRT